MKIRALVTLGLVASIFGGAATPALADNTYLACSDGNRLEIVPEEGRAFVAVVDNEPIVLHKEPGSFNNKDFTLQDTEMGWRLLSNAGVAECKQTSSLNETAVFEPVLVQPMAETTGQSWGGKVRSGPGMNFDQLDSLPEGAALTIVENAGASMNG